MPPLFNWHHFVLFRFDKEMFPNTGFTQMYVTSVTVHRGEGGGSHREDPGTHPWPYCGTTWSDVLIYFKRILKENGKNN